MKENCLITGVAGFIGFHLALKLLKQGHSVIGFDNLNDYYHIDLKKSRLKEIEKISKENNFSWDFIKGDLEDIDCLDDLIKNFKPKTIIHLAAQAGVRYSIENPDIYIRSNIVGFNNIIQKCVKHNVGPFIYASSSSVYGGNKKIPFSESDPVNHPVSLYAATKRSNELIAHSYSHIHNLSCTGIRFFTVYGPWGRPDMAPIIFAKSIIENKPLRIFNNGNMSRDFTYIDDVVEILSKLINKKPKYNLNNDSVDFDYSNSKAPHRIFNIGNGNSIPLMDFITLLEKELGKKAVKIFEEMQPGDVQNTFADTKAIELYLGSISKTSVEIGIKKFCKWFKTYYQYK